MAWYPTASSWQTFKIGQTGWKVWALQLNLNTTADGNFGPNTEAAVKSVQQAAGLLADGIAGPATQRYLCISLSKAAETKYSLPKKLLQGIVEGESGNYVACTSYETSDGGRDYGAYQDHQVDPSQATLANSFSIRYMAEDTANKLRTQKKLYATRSAVQNPKAGSFLASLGTTTDERAWKLAVLYHNWPYAADRLSRGYTIYVDGSDNEPKQWIISASGGRLSTAVEWCRAYIDSKVVYVTSWTA